MVEQPDFDFGAGRCDDDNADLISPCPVLSCVEVSVWREVPALLFFSWPSRKQLAYCAARDEDAALHADSAIEAAWYRERAFAYRKSATHDFSKK